MEHIPDWVISLFVVVIVPVLVQGLKLLFGKVGMTDKVKRAVVIAISVLLSIGAGVLFFPPDLPSWGGEPLAFLNALLAIGGPFFIGVEVLYNFVLKHLFEALGWT